MKKIGLSVKEIAENRIKNDLKKSEAVYVINYSKLSSPELTNLRQSLKSINARLFVIKNSVAKIAFKNSGLDPLLNSIEGPCGLVFIKEDPIATSRVLCNFSRDHQYLKLQGGFLKDMILPNRVDLPIPFKGTVLEQKDIESLARLPSREVLRAQVIMALKSGLSALAMVLNQTLRKFVYCLEQIKNKKGEKNG